MFCGFYRARLESPLICSQKPAHGLHNNAILFCSFQHATILLDKALDNCKWGVRIIHIFELIFLTIFTLAILILLMNDFCIDIWQISRDLVRFLRCIGADELDSPPRSPTFVKSHHPPPLNPSASVDGEDITYVVNTHSRSSSASKPPSRGSLTRGSSLDKSYLTRTSSMERGCSLSRTGLVDKARKAVAPSSPTSSIPPK